MNIHLLSIGNELLSGFTINSNAATIGQKLLLNGLSLDRITTLPDNGLILKKEIKEAMKSSRFVITTGGLGPTGDDLTRNVIAEIFEKDLVYNENVAQDLILRYGADFPSINNQSMVPRDAIVLNNQLGTAPGFILENKKSTVIALPGVSAEMEEMLKQVVLYLNRAIKNHIYIASIYFCYLSERAIDPFLRQLEKENPEVKIGICPSHGIISVFVQSLNPDLIECVKEKIINKFKPYFFSSKNKSLEHAIHEWMILNKKTLVCAESCTGGRVASRITSISGASKYFLGSIVSYSNLIKNKVLGINNIESAGAVSESVVKEMAKKSLLIADADFSLAVSGIAGPEGGSIEKPVGTVWAAIATKKEVFTGKFLAKGVPNRNLVIDYSSTYLFINLWRYLKNNHRPFS